MDALSDSMLPVALPDGRFSGRDAFRQLVREALARAAKEGWQEIILCDASFEDWPLGEREVVESLSVWSTRERRCTLLARRYDGVVRRHPRFVAWRQRWSHIVVARSCPAADPLELPSTIWSPGWVMQRVGAERCIGYSGIEPNRRLLLREHLQSWLHKSGLAFPATTLGL